MLGLDLARGLEQHLCFMSLQESRASVWLPTRHSRSLATFWLTDRELQRDPHGLQHLVDRRLAQPAATAHVRGRCARREGAHEAPSPVIRTGATVPGSLLGAKPTVGGAAVGPSRRPRSRGLVTVPQDSVTSLDLYPARGW